MFRTSYGRLSKNNAKWIGRNELFNGRQEMQTNQRQHELVNQPRPEPLASVFTRKWPMIVGRALNGSYWFREQETPLSVYHIRSGDEPFVHLASANKQDTETRIISNALHDNTRGHAVQILFEGRGVKAYVEPEWPHLKVKMSVGSNPVDFTEDCKEFGDVQGFVDAKGGGRLVLSGKNKDRVGSLAMRVFIKSKAVPETGKGSHIAFNPPRLIKKQTKKK